jgi:energy-converting hydrogenase Eha subunit A
MSPVPDLGLFKHLADALVYIVAGAVWIALHFGVRVALALVLNILIKDRAVEVSFTAIRLSEVKNSAAHGLSKLKRKAE